MPSLRGQNRRRDPKSLGGGALPSAENPGGGGGSRAEDAGGSQLRSPGAGETRRRDALDLFSTRRGQSTIWVGGFGCWYCGLSSLSSPEPASSDSPRLEVRDLGRALPVWWAPILGRVEHLGLPRVARFLTGRHVVDCCL